ncbi:MAG TPA: PDZ domain-containing protein [Blastocatellia bacterium]|nr:PDZ domain-containing protein [Blastocatellia bacterium]
MFRRLSLIITLIAALGVGLVAAGTIQKDKTKSKDQSKDQADASQKQEKQEKQKEKALLDASSAVFGLEMGAGGYLGVYLEEVTSERTKELGLQEERGAIVMKVVAGGPGEKAGLKENDVIVSFNGRRVDSVRELQRLLSETPADRNVQIEVVRGGSHQTLAATLTRRSLQSFKMNWPQLDDKSMKMNEEAFKRAEESMKHSQEAWKEAQEKWKDSEGHLKGFPPNFGEFAFVNPGDFTMFSTSRLGISAESLTDQLAQFFGVADGKGVLVASVADNSSAAKAGIKAGDVIIAVADQRVDSISSLVKALSSKSEGTVPVKIIRNHAEQTINVTLEKREPMTPRRRATTVRRQSAVI